MSERNASVLTSLQAIAKKAKERPEYRFRDLFRLLNEEMLRDSWRYIHKEAAFGVDRVSAAEYEQNLEANIHQLVEELKRKRYRAKNILRRYIPKENGKWPQLYRTVIDCNLPGTARQRRCKESLHLTHLFSTLKSLIHLSFARGGQ